MAEETPICDFGWKAPPFTLPATDGKTYSLEALRGKNGTLVMFICNHCPYVKAVIDRIVRDCEELRGLGIGAVAISSNDVVHYPEDSFANMRRFAEAHRLGFPYLYDESQDVARAYDAALHARFLRLQRRSRAAISWAPRCEPQRSGARDRPPRPVRGDAANCQDRPRSARADPVDRLLHQMESGLDLSCH